MSVPGEKEKEENAEVISAQQRLTDRANQIDQSAYDSIGNFGGFIMDGLRNILPSSPYKKNEETGEVVVKEGLNNSPAAGPRVQSINGVSDLLAVKQQPVPDALSTPFKLTADNNAAQNNQNDGPTRSTSTDGGGGRLFLGSNSSVGSFMPKPKFNISPEMQSNISDISAKVDSIKSDNKIRGSKSRMGLFGNYGKDVEIRKTYDPETNKITRSKFVDGEKVEKGKGFKGVRRAKRAGGFGRKRNK
jgi:hypothetical protein